MFKSFRSKDIGQKEDWLWNPEAIMQFYKKYDKKCPIAENNVSCSKLIFIDLVFQWLKVLI